jgi:pimeloyl-ACP methyl ester carboxylesterase
MTFDRRVVDAIELIEFLRQHLGVDKVVMLAESMGTLTGLPLERIGPDPTRWNLRAWNTNMAWAFRTNVPTPNLYRRLLFPWP